MSQYPKEPTQFKECFYQSEWYDRDFFYSPDGISRVSRSSLQNDLAQKFALYPKFKKRR